jgi:hypothetical protein
MLVLKRLKGWSFEQTEYEVRQNLVYRHLARVYSQGTPSCWRSDQVESQIASLTSNPVLEALLV